MKYQSLKPWPFKDASTHATIELQCDFKSILSQIIRHNTYQGDGEHFNVFAQFNSSNSHTW